MKFINLTVNTQEGSDKRNVKIRNNPALSHNSQVGVLVSCSQQKKEEYLQGMLSGKQTPTNHWLRFLFLWWSICWGHPRKGSKSNSSSYLPARNARADACEFVTRINRVLTSTSEGTVDTIPAIRTALITSRREEQENETTGKRKYPPPHPHLLQALPHIKIGKRQLHHRFHIHSMLDLSRRDHMQNNITITSRTKK